MRLGAVVMYLAVVLQVVDFSGRHLPGGSMENNVVCLEGLLRYSIEEAVQGFVQSIIGLCTLVVASSCLVYET